MRKPARYRWCLWSIGITIGLAAINLVVRQYLYRRGIMWQPGSIAARLNGLGGLGVFVSFAFAIAALFKDEPPLAGLAALLLSMASFLLYIR
jgi:hypothetical protein